MRQSAGVRGRPDHVRLPCAVLPCDVAIALRGVLAALVLIVRSSFQSHAFTGLSPCDCAHGGCAVCVTPRARVSYYTCKYCLQPGTSKCPL